MASAVSALTGSSPSSSAAATAAATSAPTEEMFLQLLVAQLQNQDPLNPTDSTQFVSQLAQFSELEQVMAIRTDTDSMAAAQTAAAQTAAASTPSTAPAQTPSSSSSAPSTAQTQLQ